MADEQALATDTVGLLEGIATTRAIRRYKDEPIPDDVLRDIFFAATRAPSGSNRQPFRFIVLTDSDTAVKAKELIAVGAQKLWNHKRGNDGYDENSGTIDDSPKARMARTMQSYVDNFANVPVLVLAVMVRYREPNPLEGASVYPACQNLYLQHVRVDTGEYSLGFMASSIPNYATCCRFPRMRLLQRRSRWENQKVHTARCVVFP